MATPDVDKPVKPPCRFCQSVRYLVIVSTILAWYALVRAPIGPEHPVPTHIRSAALLDAGAPTPASFALVDHRGARFDAHDLHGEWSVVALAYRGCEAPCPETLAALSGAQATLLEIDPTAASGHWLVASLDPEADTPARWARYLSGFNEALIGLTGEVGAMTELVAGLTAGATPVPGQVFVVAPGGAVRARFDPPVTADDLSADLRLIRRH
ncbi:MAG: SCO family protein [Pseudomonadota bacterium]